MIGLGHPLSASYLTRTSALVFQPHHQQGKSDVAEKEK